MSEKDKKSQDKGIIGLEKLEFKKLGNLKEQIGYEGKNITGKRLDIAKLALRFMSLLLFCILGSIVILNLEDKHHIISVFMSSTFSIITLIMGFIAGSSIDKN